MSDADELRSAASILRELAEGATPGPWRWKPAIPGKLGPQHLHPDRCAGCTAGGDRTNGRIGQVGDLAIQHDASLTWPSGRLTSGDDIWIRDAVYIATVNPLVGVALADLLDSLADDAEQFQPDDDRAAYGAPPRDELVLARLINGGA